ncbi:MAG TPA: EamA family transporter [Tepidisphaeraceae bacterium]|jgi:drug/metabolite transporter (DMT)-like permease
MLIWFAVVVRILANPFSNVFQKVLTRKGADSLFVIGLPLVVLAVLVAPASRLFAREVRVGFWGNIGICSVLAVVGNALLVQALRLSDLSVLGPINAYKSVVSLLPGVVLLHEVPSRMALAGIGLIVAGSYFLVDKGVGKPERNLFVRFFSDRGTQFRFGALILSALEAVFLKKAVLASTPVATFVFWCLLGAGVSIVSLGLMGLAKLRVELARARMNWKAVGLLTGTTGLMQLTSLLTFNAMPVGNSLALFQTSTLVSVVLGHRFFNEGHFIERMIGSGIMVGGAVLIIVGR